MIKIFEEYTRYYKYLTDKEKTDFDNAVWIDSEETEGSWDYIYIQRDRGGMERVFWDRRRKKKRRPNMEEYYSIHGYNENNNIK